jgi:hypothetical protein
MITISLDEAYIFDILSIHEIKKNKSSGAQPHVDNFNKLYTEIANQIGIDKINKILLSKEYADLVSANTETFNLVDMVKLNPCLGKEIDQSNFNRYLKKVALQEKFFQSQITETKIGY